MRLQRNIGGTTVRIHWTFWLLVAWVAWGTWSRGGSWGEVGTGIAFLLSVFACVVLHEFGHSLAARSFGIRTKDITLLPIGGLARLESMPEKPRQELIVAGAGPAVNFAIAGVLAVLQLGFAPGDGGFVGRLLAVNLYLAAFNLLPAFPMDGGRILRALLALRGDLVRATEIAVRVGRGLAVLFFAVGLFFQPVLALIGVFVWFGAGEELRAVRLRDALRDIPLGVVMDTNYVAVAPEQPLADVVQAVIDGRGENFPVVERGRVVGLLTAETLRRALRTHDPATPIAHVMDRRVDTVQSSDGTASVLSRVLQSGRAILVLRDEVLAGLVTPLRLRRILEFRGALQG